MKVVILTGGLGRRLAEEASVRPKPMAEIGGYPMLWRIMKINGACGINEFIVCLGYKGYVIKEYFANYFLHRSDVTIDLAKRVLPYVQDDAEFCLTYGDGVADVDIHAVVTRHRRDKTIATVTATQHTERFGVVEHDGQRITNFREKPADQRGCAGMSGGLRKPKRFNLSSSRPIAPRRAARRAPADPPAP